VLAGFCIMYIVMQAFAVPGTLSLSLLAGALFGATRGLLLVAGAPAAPAARAAALGSARTRASPAGCGGTALAVPPGLICLLTSMLSVGACARRQAACDLQDDVRTLPQQSSSGQ